MYSLGVLVFGNWISEPNHAAGIIGMGCVCCDCAVPTPYLLALWHFLPWYPVSQSCFGLLIYSIAIFSTGSSVKVHQEEATSPRKLVRRSIRVGVLNENSR